MERKEVKTTADLEKLIKKVKEAQKIFATYSQDQVNAIFKAAATAADKARIPLAKMAMSPIAIFLDFHHIFLDKTLSPNDQHTT